MNKVALPHTTSHWNRVTCRRGRIWLASLTLSIVIGLGLFVPPGLAQDTTQHTVIIYFFWGDGCPHCAAGRPFLESLGKKYPIEIRAYEVWYDDVNRELLSKMAEAYHFEVSGVPTIFIGDRIWVGFHQSIEWQLEAAVARCAETGCVDAGLGIIPPPPPGTPTPVPTASTTPQASSTPRPSPTAGDTPAPTAAPQPATVQGPPAAGLTLPLIGAVDLESQSLWVSTSLIALVDGFNPCSLWVLSILLALVIHTGSRLKTLFIGFIFLTLTAAVYALFIAGLFSIFTVAGYLVWFQIAVAGLALVMAVTNIKDYFWYRQGLSFTIADEQKPGLYRGIRRILAAGGSVWRLAGATFAMAVGTSFVEFACTAGFPVLWANLVTSQQPDPLTFAALLGLYLLIYQIDELGIFLAVVATMKAARLEERFGRSLKLIGGTLMLVLAVVMLAAPEWMNELGRSLLIFGGAFGAAALVLFVHRVVLPRFGIRIGNETLKTLQAPRPAQHH